MPAELGNDRNAGGAVCVIMLPASMLGMIGCTRLRRAIGLFCVLMLVMTMVPDLGRLVHIGRGALLVLRGVLRMLVAGAIVCGMFHSMPGISVTGMGLLRT